MRKKGIVFKLFWITFAFLGLFLLVVMGFQRVFFNKLYVNKKIHNTKINMDNFIDEYKSSSWTTEEVLEKINIFSEENNTLMIIMNEEGDIKFRDQYEKSSMTIKDTEGRLYTVHLKNIMYLYAFHNFIPNVGDEIYVEGIIESTNPLQIQPLKFKQFGIEYFDENIVEKYKDIYSKDHSNKIVDNKELLIKSFTGKVMSIDSSFNNRGYDFYKKSLLWNKAYSYWLYDNTSDEHRNNDHIEYGFYQEPGSEFKNVMFAKYLKKNDTDEIVLAITSLQPINEATNFMNDYIIYFVLLALVFIIVLSFIFSKIISKPLLEMNNIAKKMAGLDFTVHSEVNSDDELGSLSNSLNTLCTNLNTSMTELKRANEKLQDDIEKERKQEQIRKEFVANVSHEIRTPLGIIKGFAEGIKDGIYKEKKGYYLDVIIDEIEKMNVMLIEMLELTKLESKTYSLFKSNFNIEELIIDVTRKFHHIIEEKNIHTDYNLEKSFVFADRSKVEQVIVNLLSNAIKYTENYGQIYINTKGNENKIYVYIFNTGEQMSEKDLKKIWDRFYRIDKSRSRALGGTGLGLPIVKNILELHESEYGVRNIEKGIEFYFTLNISTD